MKGKHMTRTEWEPLRLKRIEEYKAMTVKEMRKAFLDDTIAHYNSGNRAVNEDYGSCLYSPTETSCGCAIGRWLPLETQTTMVNGSVNEEHISDLLPEWMVEMGLGFLCAVQNLHDMSRYWDAAGLTEFGTREADSIRRRFKLN